MTDACTEIVRRDDPHLFATALFAPEPARSRLMVLYAFDIELSRATAASAEPLIGRMRLQWWRDVIGGAAATSELSAPDVAGAVSELVVRYGGALLFGAMIDGHECELDAPMDWPAHYHWADYRFAPRFCAAVRLLTDGGVAPLFPPSEMTALTSQDGATALLSMQFHLLGQAAGAAFAVEHAADMARRGHATLLPSVSPNELAALGRGKLLESLRKDYRRIAERQLQQVSSLRRTARPWDARIIPALLPLSRAVRVLRIARRPDFSLGHLDRIDRPFDGLRLAWRARSGRW